MPTSRRGPQRLRRKGKTLTSTTEASPPARRRIRKSNHGSWTGKSWTGRSRTGEAAEALQCFWELPEARLQRLCACTAPPGNAQKLRNCNDFVLVLLHRGGPRSSAKLPEAARKLSEAPGSPACTSFALVMLNREGPEAPPLERLCASNTPPGSAQGCANAQYSQCSPKLVPVLVGKNHSAPSAHTK